MNLGMKWVAEYHGPNPLAGGPVVVAELTCASLPAPEQIAQASANLWAHSGMDAPEQPGGTDDVLHGLGETAACWARAALNEVRGYVQHAGARRVGGSVLLWLGFHQPELSRIALQMALQAFARMLTGQGNQQRLKEELERLWKACRSRHPDFQARILMVAAREKNIPCLPFLPDSRYWQFGWGEKSRVFFETSSNEDGALGRGWQKNKVVSKELMQLIGLPTPAHVLVTREEELAAAVALVGFPCVVKPQDSGGGRGVTADINDNANLLHAFRIARQVSRGPLMVEQHVSGTDFRLMTVNGKFLAAIAREASCLVGDGATTVRALLAELNASRFDNLVKSRYLRPIAVDDVLVQHLSAQGLQLDDVLPVGQKVTLRSNANRSTGGICRDVTDSIHPEVRAMAEQFALAIGLKTAGLDYLTRDITRPPREAGGAFIEINATPGMAVFVAAGWSEAAIGRVVLGDKPGRIPVELSILPPDRLPEELRSLHGKPLDDGEGWVCGSDLRIGRAALRCELKYPWSAVQAALRNPCLQRLRVVCSAQDIERFGLPLDGFCRVDLQDSRLGAPWKSLLEDACPREIQA